MDPHLSAPHVFGRSDYPNYEMTVLLKCFAVSVHSIRLFEWGSVMGFNYPNISVI